MLKQGLFRRNKYGFFSQNGDNIILIGKYNMKKKTDVESQISLCLVKDFRVNKSIKLTHRKSFKSSDFFSFRLNKCNFLLVLTQNVIYICEINDDYNY